MASSIQEMVQNTAQKKTDLAEHSWVINQVGLLVNEPTGLAGLLFI
jgi:hypothetical protein